jgi:hypothetical protein
MRRTNEELVDPCAFPAILQAVVERHDDIADGLGVVGDGPEDGSVSDGGSTRA